MSNRLLLFYVYYVSLVVYHKYPFWYSFKFFSSSRRRHTRCALVTGVQTCALPIFFRLVEKGIEQIAGGQLIPDAIYRPAHLILRALDFLFDFRRVARVLFSHGSLQYR